MIRWLSSFYSLLFPRCCVVCGAPLSKSEAYLCVKCQLDLPRTDIRGEKENPVEKLFWGRIPIERASSWLLYRKGSDFRQILHLLKYGGCKELGQAMGRMMATELLSGDFFGEIDVIIPVPLHRKKQRRRGYNQSEWIARGISDVTHIPVDVTAVIRRKNTETQTRKSTFERWANVEGTFLLLHPERFAGKHILIVDDVLTTGATTVACAVSFGTAESVRISVLTLAVADR